MIIGQNEFGDCPVPFLDVRTGPDCHETLEDLLCITDFPVLLQGFNGLQLFPTYEVRNFNFHTFHMIVNRYRYMIINDANIVIITIITITNRIMMIRIMILYNTML